MLLYIKVFPKIFAEIATTVFLAVYVLRLLVFYKSAFSIE